MQERARILLHRARADAHVLRQRLNRPAEVVFVTTSYDTAFEPVADQVMGRIEQLIEAYGVDGPLRWTLQVVDDLPEDSGFVAGVEEAFKRAPAALRDQARLHCSGLFSAPRRAGGFKGQALLDGMAAALDRRTPDALAYINLNLKVHAAYAAPGLRAMLLDEACDAAIGTRAPEHGGAVVGAGPAGRIKSRVYAEMARRALPVLSGYRDTNAPLKIFRPEAAAHLIEHGRIGHVTMDCEWLMLLHEGPFAVQQFPIAWVQRPGSKPPWHLVGLTVRDLVRTRRRWRQIRR